MSKHHPISTAFLRLAAALVLLLAGVPGRAAGQEPPGERAGTISGLIVDAGSSTPLVDATVVLEPRAVGAFPARTRGSGAFLQATRTTRTDSEGRYRFEEAPPGEYRLHVQRLGYRSTTVEVELRGAGASTVSVGLEVEPVALLPVEVSVPGLQPEETYGRREPGNARGSEEGRRRVAVERLRQERHLASDVRAVTHADVAEGITLGETDLFRALQRLPGVSTRDEFSAELWTRGATWDQTRVYFDGFPLFNPVHALGGFSGLNPDAVGAAFLHPGMQPVSLGGGAAGALDLRSRRGGGGGEVRGTGELSLVSGRLALDGVVGEDGQHAWMVAGRRTYLDWLTRAVERATDAGDVHVPYHFADFTSRYDWRLGERSSIETSTLLTYDEVSGDVPDVLHRTSAHWGGGTARITLQTPLRGATTRHTLGFSGFSSMFRRLEGEPEVAPGLGAPKADPSDNTVWYYSLGGEARPEASSAWAAGYEFAGHYLSYFGAWPGEPRTRTMRHPWDRDLHLQGQLFHGVLWGERRWKPREALTVEAGIRLEAGPRVRNAGVLRPAPRLAARLEAAPGTFLSAALGRSYQYTQAVAPAGPEAVPASNTEYLWVLAGDTTPAIRADVATVGAERWIGDRWLASATAYYRRSSGIATPDPTPGATRGRPLFVTAEGRARGAELSLRRLAGRWTASAAYSYGVSEVLAAGLRFPAPADQRHVLDATAMLRLGRGWQLGAAYTAASGLPFTRSFSDAECTEEQECIEVRRMGEPGAQRMPAYRSLDLLADWNHEFRGWSLGAYLQLRNALNRRNAARYSGSVECHVYGGCRERPEPYDHFEQGLPVLPVLGVRVAF